MINYYDSRVMIGFDILDSTRSEIERCIKVEFAGESILMGVFDGSTLIFMLKADANDLEITEYRKVGASPADLADKAAEWAVSELSRKSGYRSMPSRTCSFFEWFRKYL